MVHEWVTGGGLAGSPLPEDWALQGRAMRRAIAADWTSAAGPGARVIVTLDAALPDDPGPWTIVRIGAGEHERRVRELAQSVDFTILVAPETGGVLAGLTDDLTRAGARMLGSTSEAVALTGDKERLAAWLRAEGVDTPPVRRVVPGNGLPTAAIYPAVIKPIDGAGSEDTYYVRDPESMPSAARRLPEALLQPFVPGSPMSASFLVDRHGRAWLAGVGSQRIAVRGARFQYEGGAMPVRCPGALPAAVAAVDAIAGLRGFVGVDFIYDSAREHATILEINPRPTTSLVGLCSLLRAGRLARAWFAACRGSGADFDLLAGLSEHVHRQDCIMFDSDGSLMSCTGGSIA
jgi:predicted ATP-grasp superfamily ATP-dependent carboligase